MEYRQLDLQRVAKLIINLYHYCYELYLYRRPGIPAVILRCGIVDQILQPQGIATAGGTSRRTLAGIGWPPEGRHHQSDGCRRDERSPLPADGMGQSLGPYLLYPLDDYPTH